MRTLRICLEYYVPWTNDIGYQLAIERGWYREVGIDLRQVLPDPFLGDTLEHVTRGEADFGVFLSNRLFVRHEAGQPLLAIAAITQRALETILTLAGNGIERPRELTGRRVALNPTPRGIAMVRHLIAADGGNPDDSELIDSGPREVNAEDLKDGLAAAFFGAYWAWAALVGNVTEVERVAWPIDEIGAPPYPQLSARYRGRLRRCGARADHRLSGRHRTRLPGGRCRSRAGARGGAPGDPGRASRADRAVALRAARQLVPRRRVGAQPQRAPLGSERLDARHDHRLSAAYG